MTKKLNPAVRLFSASSPESRPIIETPNGPIYAGTPEADQWLALKAWADPLKALADSIGTMTFDKAQAVADIAALFPKLPDSAASTAATLYDLSEAMQGRLSNRTRDYFGDVAQAYAHHVTHLRLALAPRAQDAMASLVVRAPKPPNINTVQPDPGQPLGTGHRQRNA